MNFTANKGKNIEITVENEVWYRYAIKTHFVTQGESYTDIVEKYVSEIYREGDILSISEKIISLCQGRIIRCEDVKIGMLAGVLSRFASHENRGGYGVGLAINMQYAIDKAGSLRVIFAAIIGGICKVFGVKGVFYKLVGQEVSGLDGFYDGIWNEYRDIGIEIPLDPDGVCDEIRRTLGISCMIVDANDFGQEILGASYDVEMSHDILKQMIRDNPAGQGRECTPLVLIRRK